MWIETSQKIGSCFDFLKEAQTTILLYSVTPGDKNSRRQTATLFDALPETRSNLHVMRKGIESWAAEQKILLTKSFMERIRNFRKSYAPTARWLRMINRALKEVEKLESQLRQVTERHPLW